eukprot:Gb_04995 [translate_table: standard]
MVHCLHLARFPKGLINCVTGKGSKIGDFLPMHPGVNCINFTCGDTSISISKKARMILLQMELGGGGWRLCIVLKDMDLDLEEANVVKGGFSYSGAILSSLEYMGLTEKTNGIDQRKEMMLKLMHRIRDIEIQLKEQTKWAHQKVMQVARKLNKDLVKLKTLRMERDEMLRLYEQALEDTTMKRLYEMENTLQKASCQVNQANATVRRLETKNAKVREKMEASNLIVVESITTCQEVANREKKCLKELGLGRNRSPRSNKNFLKRHKDFSMTTNNNLSILCT